MCKTSNVCFNQGCHMSSATLATWPQQNRTGRASGFGLGEGRGGVCTQAKKKKTAEGAVLPQANKKKETVDVDSCTWRQITFLAALWTRVCMRVSQLRRLTRKRRKKLESIQVLLSQALPPRHLQQIFPFESASSSEVSSQIGNSCRHACAHH